MEDDQTGSLWSQISGECIKGELIGKKLKLYPAQFATFPAKEGLRAIKYLVKPEKGPEHSVYKEYFEDRGRMGVFGTMYKDSLLESKEIVYGIRTLDYQVAVPGELFADRSAYLVDLGEMALLLVAGKESEIICYRLPNQGQGDWKIEFEGDKVTINPGKGAEHRIEFQGGIQTRGRSLEQFPVITAFWFAWKSFFPASEIFQP